MSSCGKLWFKIISGAAIISITLIPGVGIVASAVIQGIGIIFLADGLNGLIDMIYEYIHKRPEST